MGDYDVESRVRYFLERELDPERNPRGFVTFMAKNVAVGAILAGHRPRAGGSGLKTRRKFSIRISLWLAQHVDMTVFGKYRLSIINSSPRRGHTYRAELIDNASK